MPTADRKLNAFLCHANEDKSTVRDLYRQLTAEGWMDVWLDEIKLLPGQEWDIEIEKAVEQADVVIVCLSNKSVDKEGYVQKELRFVLNIADEKPEGTIFVIPLRLDDCAVPRRIRAWQYVDYFPKSNQAWAYQRLIESLKLRSEKLGISIKIAQIPARETLPRPTPSADISRLESSVERPGGTMDVESFFYVERNEDTICQRDLKRGGSTIVIKAPRQMGKSSMLVRAATQAQQLGREVVFLDFQTLDEEDMNDPQRFFQVFCRWIADELGVDGSVDEIWQGGLGHTQSCTKFFRQYILKRIEKPITLVMDEVDRMLTCPFRSDFFGMLRNWHNNRAIGIEWRKLDLLLVISTEPHFLIDDLNLSPFNVVEPIRLKDFNLSQITDLNNRHGNPFSPLQIEQLQKLVGGHPYLTRVSFYHTASGESTAEVFFANALEDEGPFSDHLHRYLTWFRERPNLARAMLEIIQKQKCNDEIMYDRLHSAGLVLRTGLQTVPRCELYAQYFRERLSHG